MAEPRWYFSRRRPSAGRARNPQIEKFFRSDVVEDQTNAIIREGIQNSLDAGIPDVSKGSKSIIVQVTFGVCQSGDVEEYLPGLFDHLDEVRDKLPDIPMPGQPVRYLAFEDFNTTGLKGDPLEWDPPDNKNAFFNFFRGEGVTNKAGNQRGRHGVGKLVFSAASRAKSILGLTATDENGPVLMGTSTLVLHKLNKLPYDPDGWFGIEESVAGDTFVGPVRDPAIVDRFISAFALERDTLPGLSIVIPWLNESVTPETALASVLRGFFWPILQKRLYVDIKSPDATTTVSAETLSQHVERLSQTSDSSASALKPSIDLALWALQVPDVEFLELSVSADTKPAWTADCLPDDVKSQLAEVLLNERPTALRVPMGIRRKGVSAADADRATFDIFLKPDSGCSEGSVQFIREGLLIPGVKCRRCPGFRALVIVDDGPLASFLGDAENPSHTEWQVQNVKEKYTYPAETLRYVVQSVPEILKLLHGEQKEKDATLMLDLLALPSREPAGPTKKLPGKSKSGGEKTKPDDVQPPPPRPKRYALSRREAGFVIRQGAPGTSPPRVIDVLTAYVSRRGNPLKRYRTDDFRLNSKAISVSVEGGSIELCEDNKLRVALTAPEFQIAVSGFDTNRDLWVDVKVDAQEAADAEDV